LNISALQIKPVQGKAYCIGVFVAEEGRVTRSGELVSVNAYVVFPDDTKEQRSRCLASALDFAKHLASIGRPSWIQASSFV
jgi:hypothetical protein